MTAEIDTILEREFPGRVELEKFVTSTREVLAPHGFDDDNTIACVGGCRDELTRPLIDRVFEAWGEAFNFSSLAGLLTLGRTGFAAARSHAPRFGGRERFVFIAMPHIGIHSDGTLGAVRRHGQQAPSPTCAALSTIVEALKVGDIAAELDPDDIEQSLLHLRVGLYLEETDQDPAELDLARVTRAMTGVISTDLEQLIGGVDMTDVDYAVFSGVQIHAPDDAEYVWPDGAYAVVAGERIALPTASTPE